MHASEEGFMTTPLTDRPATALLQPGAFAPEFALMATPDQKLRLRELRGNPAILVFYPADWSPVCGDQLALYNEILDEFRRHHALIVGISVDGVWSHREFAAQRRLRFPLNPGADGILSALECLAAAMPGRKLSAG